MGELSCWRDQNWYRSLRIAAIGQNRKFGKQTDYFAQLMEQQIQGKVDGLIGRALCAIKWLCSDWAFSIVWFPLGHFECISCICQRQLSGNASYDCIEAFVARIPFTIDLKRLHVAGDRYDDNHQHRLGRDGDGGPGAGDRRH